jgi:hypothetical protein
MTLLVILFSWNVIWFIKKWILFIISFLKASISFVQNTRFIIIDSILFLHIVSILILSDTILYKLSWVIIDMLIFSFNFLQNHSLYVDYQLSNLYLHRNLSSYYLFCQTSRSCFLRFLDFNKHILDLFNLTEPISNCF